MTNRYLKRGMQSLGACAAFSLLLTNGAQAAEGGQGMGLQKGHGILLGRDAKTKIHLELDLGLGYNTNPYSLAGDSTAARATGDMQLKIRPGITLSNDGKKIAASLGIDLDWAMLPDIAHGGADARTMLFQGGLKASAEANKEGAMSLYIKEALNLNRTPDTLFVNDTLLLNNNTTVGATMRPSAQVSVDVDGQYGFSHFPKKDVTSLGNADTVDFNTDSLYGHGRIDWKAFSKGSMFLDGKGGQFGFRNDRSVFSTPLWTQVGVKAELSPKFSGTLAVGYANPFTQNAVAQVISSDYMGLTFLMNGVWRYAARSSFEFNFSRDMSPVSSFLHVSPLAGSLKYEHWFGEKVSINLGANTSYLEFGLPLANRGSSADHRRDIMFGANAGITWHIRKWFKVGLSDKLDTRWTNAQDLTVSANPNSLLGNGNRFTFSYIKNETMLMISFNY